MKIITSLFVFLLASFLSQSRASIAYGSINNFDTVNDTGKVCHGFEIEIEDCRSVDISYTYDYNHYGTPKITQDDSIPGHPKCVIRWESKRNPDGSWASSTAIPSGPIAPTDGHQFTDPSVNFGGEHFGVGYNVAVGAIRYHWLVEDLSGQLVYGGDVQIATPSFVYYPPIQAQPAQPAQPAKVQAIIEPPVVEMEPNPDLEFGPAVWVKEIRTVTHNPEKVALRDLVSDDPARDDEKNWRNGEPDEVEVEWQILQKELSKPDGGNNGRLEAAPEELNQGDEVVTRRYEFYEYVGPIDANGEAKASQVGPDDLHGQGIKIIDGVSVDLANVVVVGAFKGAPMSAVDVEAAVGLIDHLNDAEVQVTYADRRVIVPGAKPFTAEIIGSLPRGMSFDAASGVLSGTPEEAGAFPLTIRATELASVPIAKQYVLQVAAAGQALAVQGIVQCDISPLSGGTVQGTGVFAPGAEVVLSATALPGYQFDRWEEQGTILSRDASYVFAMGDVNRNLQAVFVIADQPNSIVMQKNPAAGVAFALEWSVLPEGWILEESSDLSANSWRESTRADAPHDGVHHVEISDPAPKQLFFRWRKP